MIKTTASRFKTQLGKYMRAVRGGGEVLVTDRGEPVAKLVPAKRQRSAARLEVSQGRDPAAGPLGRVEVRAIRYAGPSSLALLRADRDAR